MRKFAVVCWAAFSTMATSFVCDIWRVCCLWVTSLQMLMFLLADLSSMKPNCLRQPDDDALSTVGVVCSLEPVKFSRLMLMRCPAGASNNQGRSRLPQMTPSPLLLLFGDEGNRNFCSLLTATWHDRSGCTTTKELKYYFYCFMKYGEKS